MTSIIIFLIVWAIIGVLLTEKYHYMPESSWKQLVLILSCGPISWVIFIFIFCAEAKRVIKEKLNAKKTL